MVERTSFEGRIEELPFIAAYLLVSLKRDKLLFKAHSPVFDDAYIGKFEAQKTVVDKMVDPAQLTGERKVITKLVATDYKKVRNTLNRLEDYLKLTDAPLTIAVGDFGIKTVRAELEAKNDEGIVRQLKIVFKNAEDNKVALEPAGYTAAVSTEFSDLIDSLTTDSIAQNLKLDSRIALTQENIKELNKLWKIMDKVLESGKTIAKEKEDDLMFKDYTFTNLQKKVRQEHKAAEKPAS